MMEINAPLAEEVANMEHESLLKTAKGKQLQDAKTDFSPNEIILVSTQQSPNINGRTSLPAYSETSRPMLQRNDPDRMVKLWKQQSK